MSSQPTDSNRPQWHDRLHEIIFEADTPAGKLFDIVLIGSIACSVAVVLLDSIAEVQAKYGDFLYATEWFFTILFTIEYTLRLISVRSPLKYATSFFGVVDLLAIAPTYLSLFLPGGQYLLTIRVLRLLRIFRVFKLVTYINEAQVIITALQASHRKISVFLFTVMNIVIIIGSVMYVVEGAENGFVNIPTSIYWAIVTLTTVGYGDISPQTALGKMIASMVMIIGFAIIAVPTGIVTAELAQAMKSQISTRACPSCSLDGHDHDAIYCKYCSALL
ncbi:ion transporter [Anaerolineales bacterium HSG6]|nr:ion transporter [Anaerolineales bacterium HSG6]MDM8531129.1 ion transporter [Anaerolineales bacterium HSG25]